MCEIKTLPRGALITAYDRLMDTAHLLDALQQGIQRADRNTQQLASPAIKHLCRASCQLDTTITEIEAELTRRDSSHE